MGKGSSSRKKENGHFLAFAVAATAVLAGCGSSSNSSSSGSTTTQATPAGKAASSTPYVMHAILSETGAGSFLGAPQAAALKGLAVLFNKQGGIDGHPLQFDIQDDQSTPSTAVSYATSLVSSHVPFILGPTLPPAAAAVDALATSNGPLIYQLAPSPSPKPGSMVFAAGTPVSLDAQSYLTFLKSKGITKIAAITSTDATGANALTILKAALTEPQFSSLHLVAQETFDPTAISVTTQLSVIKAANPQALVIWTVGTPLGVVLQGMSSQGMDNIPTITSNGNATYSELTHFASILPKTFYFPEESLDLPPANIANAAVRAKVQTFDTVIEAAGGRPGDAFGLSWDPAEFLIGAIKKLGVSATAPQILNYMENLHNVTGTFGVYNFSTSNHSGLSVADMFMTVWNGSSFTPASGPGGTPLASASAG